MSELFGPLLSTPEATAATSDAAWLRAMLRFEAELAAAEAAVGVIPAAAAAAIREACEVAAIPAAEIGRAAIASANPVVPFVRALTTATGEAGQPYVHWGATSQDVLDTAAMLIARDATGAILADLDGLAEAAAGHAAAHRQTVMAARTLMQQAVPTTFGLKAAGWMAAADAAAAALRSFRPALQLGGAAGTLASLGSRGLDVRAELARRLDLAEPDLSWHADRTRIAELAGALALAGGAAGKIAIDVILLAQTEVGEVQESAPGGSSTMPQKRNPAAAISADAAARSLLGPVGVLFASMRAEHERAAGAWQAEWLALTAALRFAAGAVARARESVSGLRVDASRMRSNAALTGGLLNAESVQTALAGRLGRARAHEAVAAAASSSDFGGALAGDPATAGVAGADLESILDPASYLGAAEAMIDRALKAHRSLRRNVDE